MTKKYNYDLVNKLELQFTKVIINLRCNPMIAILHIEMKYHYYGLIYLFQFNMR